MMDFSDWLIVALFLAAFVIGVAGYGGVSSDVTLSHPITQHAAPVVVR
jgi:hypothetical protein